MSQITHSEHLGWKEYWKLLGSVGRFFMIFAVSAALLSTIFYRLDAPGIEQITHRSLSTAWPGLLLWLPIAIQLIVFSRLRSRLRHAVSESKLRAYFKFYFWRMALSLAAYTLLWGCYVGLFALGVGSRVILYVSWLPLLGIVVLLGMIVHATYLITKTSFHDDEYLFRDEDVRAKYPDICEVLKKGSSPQIEKIREWLRKDRDCKIHRATLAKEVSDLDVGHLTEALNRLICSAGFCEAIQVNEQERKRLATAHPNEVELVNRSYLDAYMLGVSGSNGKTKSDKQLRKERRNQEKLIKQKEQQDGIAMFPFYTMVFFFSIFLCIAYLYSFAFAFEDRYVQQSDRKGPVAMFMSDDTQEDAGHYSAAVTSPTPGIYQLSDRQKIFYFNSGGAGITTETVDGNVDGKLRHIARINGGSLNSLEGFIRAALAKSTVRILLIGRADDNSVDKVSYSSNYEIAAARVKNVRYLLQESLIADHISPKALDRIEWIESPLSNDRTLPPKERRPAETSKLSLVLNNQVGIRNNPRAIVPKEFINNLNREIWNSGSKDWKVELRDSLERLQALSQGSVALDAMQKILDDIHQWDALRASGKTEDAKNSETTSMQNSMRLRTLLAVDELWRSTSTISKSPI